MHTLLSTGGEANLTRRPVWVGYDQAMVLGEASSSARAAEASSRAPRRMLALVLAAMGALVAIASGKVRLVEAAASSWVTRLSTGTVTATTRADHAFYWGVGTPQIMGLSVTMECTTAFLIGAMLVVSAMCLVGRRVSARTLVIGAAAVSLWSLAWNVGRLSLIAWATYRYGMSGYHFTHTFVGSLISIGGTASGVAFFVWFVFLRRTPPPPAAPSSSVTTTEGGVAEQSTGL